MHTAGCLRAPLSKAFVAGLLAVTLAFASSAAFAQGQIKDLSAQGAQVHSGEAGQGLTLPSQASPAAVVANFLRAQGFGGQTVASLVQTVQSTNQGTGSTHLRFTQQADGLTVYGTYVKATVGGDGALVHLIENLASVGGGPLPPALIDEGEALDAALAAVHPGVTVDPAESGRSGNTVSFSGGDFFHQDPTVTSVAVPMDDGLLQEGYLVETWSDEDNQLHHTVVGGDGSVLYVELRTNDDSYNIFPDQPLTTPQAVVDGPGAGNAESPNGWLGGGAQTTVDISGNNVHAYLDRNNNNAPDGGGGPVGDGNFITAANLGDDPTTTPNQAVAVQNLFYFNNVIHDKLYRHGFNEAAGNFQENNFGKGGAGSDSVNAEAQDGGGTNNANFATPSDGSNPRMQMYLWTRSDPRRDGDLDSDIIWHEYGHGLTWRMIGGMSGSMSGAIGEGMSDVLSILINNDDVVGEYSYNTANGIRSEPYDGYSRTYGDFTGGSVHYDGEIYAAIGWKLGELFDGASVSRDTLFDYIVGGMNFTPSGPAFEDMRDGILARVEIATHDCLVWEAFATFGVGVGAKGQAKGGGPFGGGKVDVTESFDMPAECSSSPPPPPPPPPSGEGSGSVKGTVSAPGDPRLSGVLVEIDDSGTDPSGSSNNGGKYSIADVAAGTWPIAATKTGYCEFSSNVTVADGQTTTLNIEMTPVGDGCP